MSEMNFEDSVFFEKHRQVSESPQGGGEQGPPPGAAPTSGTEGRGGGASGAAINVPKSGDVPALLNAGGGGPTELTEKEKTVQTQERITYPKNWADVRKGDESLAEYFNRTENDNGAASLQLEIKRFTREKNLRREEMFKKMHAEDRIKQEAAAAFKESGMGEAEATKRAEEVNEAVGHQGGGPGSWSDEQLNGVVDAIRSGVVEGMRTAKEQNQSPVNKVTNKLGDQFLGGLARRTVDFVFTAGGVLLGHKTGEEEEEHEEKEKEKKEEKREHPQQDTEATGTTEKPAKSGEEMDRIQAKLEQIAGKEFRDPLSVLPKDKIEADLLKEQREKMWKEFKNQESNPLLRPHVQWKNYVSSLMASIINGDQRSEKDAEFLPADSGVIRTDPLNDMLGYMDNSINRLEGLSGRQEYDAMQLAWLKGVRRNIELPALEAELALYKKYGLETNPSLIKRMAEVTEGIKRLGVETKYLNITGKDVDIKPETLEKISMLVARYVNYLENSGNSSGIIKEAKQKLKDEEEAEKRTAQAPSTTPTAEQGGGGGKVEGRNGKDRYTPEQALRLFIDASWRNPTSAYNEATMRNTIADMRESTDKRIVDLATKMEKIIKLANFLPDPKNIKTGFEEWANNLFNGMDGFTVIALLNDSDMLLGVKCVAEMWGIQIEGGDEVTQKLTDEQGNPVGNKKVTKWRIKKEYNEKNLEAFRTLGLHDKPEYGKKIRKEIAKELPADAERGYKRLESDKDYDDARVYLSFIFGYNFLKMCGLPAQLVREYYGLHGKSNPDPGYFHPDVFRPHFEMRYPDIAFEEVAKRSATAPIANGGYVQKILEERGEGKPDPLIMGRPWSEMLSNPYRWESFAYSTGVFNPLGEGDDKEGVQLLARIMGRRITEEGPHKGELAPVEPWELQNTPALAMNKINTQVSKTRDVVMNGGAENKFLFLESTKALIRTPWAQTLFEKEIVREIDDMAYFDRADRDALSVWNSKHEGENPREDYINKNGQKKQRLKLEFANIRNQILSEMTSEVFIKKALIKLGMDSDKHVYRQNALSAAMIAEALRNPPVYVDPKDQSGEDDPDREGALLRRRRITLQLNKLADWIEQNSRPLNPGTREKKIMNDDALKSIALERFKDPNNELSALARKYAQFAQWGKFDATKADNAFDHLTKRSWIPTHNNLFYKTFPGDREVFYRISIFNSVVFDK